MATPPGLHKQGATYLVTKRTILRLFLLKHTDLATQIILYCLGYFLQKSETIRLHAFVVMSNHFHLLLTCEDGNKPDFVRGFHSLVARALNCLYKRSGAVFDKDSPNYVECVNKEDIIDKGAYTLANPVLALLCRSRAAWPGGISLDSHLDGKVVLRILKPTIFFSRRMPEYVEILIKLPPGFGSLEEWRLAVTKAADFKEEQVRIEVAREGKRFKTKAELRKTSPFANPWGGPTGGSSGKRGGESGYVPQIAAKDKETREAVKRELRAFRLAYRKTLEIFRAGLRDVVWPYGTYKMRRIYDCPCAGPPA